MCKAQHGLIEPIQSSPLAKQHVPPSTLTTDTALSLVSLTHHSGVNALAKDQTVSFGPNLTLVYGENTAGKSGYVRILKQVCRSRFVEDILGNVLDSGAPLKAQVSVCAKDGTTGTEIQWASEDSPSTALAQISVFDSHCVPIYLRDKTDVAFRPFGLDVLDKLAGVCAAVKKRLNTESQLLTTQALPPLPRIAPGTKARQIVDSLTALTKKEDVRSAATLSTAEEKRLKHLIELSRDLQANDPKKRAVELLAKAKRVEMLAAHLKMLEDVLGLNRTGFLGGLISWEDGVYGTFKSVFAGDP